MENAEKVLAEAGWRSMESAPKDGTEILLYAHGMVIQARYSPGRWSEDTPICPAEYDGAVWVAFDDVVQFEIEEGAGPDGEDWHGPVTRWKPLDTPDQPDPVIALCQCLLEENKAQAAALTLRDDRVKALEEGLIAARYELEEGLIAARYELEAYARAIGTEFQNGKLTAGRDGGRSHD